MPQKPHSKASILLVDDHSASRKILCAALAPEYDVKTAVSGPECLSVASRSPYPDLILLDVLMPEMDGFEVCRRLKAEPRTRPIPIIFLTVKSEEAEETRGLELGAADYITRPCSIAKIKTRLKTHLELKTLRESTEQRYRLLAENTTDVIWTIDLEGRCTYVSPSLTRLRGYTPEEVMAQSLSEMFMPSSYAIVDQAFRQRMEKEKGTAADEKIRQPRYFELEMPRKDGSTVWVEAITNPLRNEDGELMGVLGVSRDISERREYTDLLNKAYGMLEKKVEARTSELKAANLELSREIDERQRYETESKALQEKLIWSERLAATGQLAASIAHEINSPLQAMTALVSTLRGQYKADTRLCSDLDLLREALNRIAETVKNLLDLNRPITGSVQNINVNKVLEKTLALLRVHLKRNRVDIDLALDSHIPEIQASPQQLSHLFLNLINNAVEAMTGVSAPNRPPGPESAQKHVLGIQTAFATPDLVIQIRDNGPGFEPTDLKRVFEPFYTRKKKMGIGVGLTICHGIVNECKGTIEADNPPDGGAMITIRLPVAPGR